MSGLELIERIVKECRKKQVPPTDTAIVNHLRTVLDVCRPLDSTKEPEKS